MPSHSVAVNRFGRKNRTQADSSLRQPTVPREQDEKKELACSVQNDNSAFCDK
jgi:hypothetical protein